MRRELITITVVTAGCSGTITEPDEDGRMLGVLEHHGEEAAIEMPAQVEAGEPFTVTVHTFGGGCIGEGDTESSVDGMGAVIRPYDYEHSALIREDAACLDILRIYEHEATIRFSDRGIGWVRVYGRRLPGGEVVTVTRRVLVE